MKRPSDVEKLSSDKRLAWRALSTLGAQLPLMDAALSVEEIPLAAGMPTATVTVSIPNGHTLAKGPTVAMEMLSNHADLLHSYCDEEGCICMEYVLNLTWSGGRPFVSAPRSPLNPSRYAYTGSLIPNSLILQKQRHSSERHICQIY